MDGTDSDGGQPLEWRSVIDWPGLEAMLAEAELAIRASDGRAEKHALVLQTTQQSLMSMFGESADAAAKEAALKTFGKLPASELPEKRGVNTPAIQTGHIWFWGVMVHLMAVSEGGAVSYEGTLRVR